MALPSRSRRSSPVKSKPVKRISGVEVSIPTHFRCPISLDLMKDPVTASTGITYDRASIEAWLEMGNATCPVTNRELKDEDLIPNHSIRKMIQDWCVADRSHGIERIPTPKVPITKAQVMDIVSEVVSASRRRDRSRCGQLVAKVRSSVREGERNRRCFESNGTGRALAAAFGAFAVGSSVDGSETQVLEEILAALTTLLPLDEEAASHVGSPESLTCLVSILKHGDLVARLNAAVVVKELLACGEAREDGIADTAGLVEALVKLIKEPVLPQTTKASLVAVFYLTNYSEKTASRVVGMGLVPVVIETLVDAEKSMCEKLLAVLDSLVGCDGGREQAYGHALTTPVLVKKMFRVSDTATEFVVSALWKLCSGKEGEGEEGEGRGRCLREAQRAGAFHKLLLLLQVGCGEATKEKTTALLRLLNGYRKDECIDTTDFKGLKRPLLPV
ncbi:hypothetical protein OPV22_000544 [Ensete ventricosum]|uniref:U-box domain-containing protein n=1 Tax=Ensete ventricosum TaxID=4639 RepID=A0AAV8QB21_ENSVE|nr:hypothetical protein OPV22_000544 [Ensete ventricosum]